MHLNVTGCHGCKSVHKHQSQMDLREWMIGEIRSQRRPLDLYMLFPGPKVMRSVVIRSSRLGSGAEALVESDSDEGSDSNLTLK